VSLKVLIADDEQLARQRLQRLLQAQPGAELAGEVKDGDELLRWLEDHPQGADVVLLDVQMPKLTGPQALALWPADGPLVVFCTAHAEHAVKAFDAGAVDYLLKPVEAARLKTALERAKDKGALTRFRAEAARHAKEGLDRLPITTRQGVVLVDPLQVTHAVLEGELVTVHTRAQAYLCDFSLQELEARLPAGKFERVHRRALVNLEHVARLEPLETGGYTAHLQSGLTVEVSRQAARDLRKRLGLRKGADDDAP